ncbi:PEP-CTERM sorting domain-containing protein [Paucibacter sp. R3-3]|uniref:PEP-CTERM sorting domain-containing protein n=1 Tax=Roseateles agri TaxID=3098619 RepID=A0ABU5DHJ7_9BURK|nr:PEP-CTERM sorting domain-containing protein [Paucibacter sp. R3-3]MDY0745765.1 PEP-CTERM sorting domain-containing protein [Paucibacter sp. R3-3]
MHSVRSAAGGIKRIAAIACLSLSPFLAHAADVYSQPFAETAAGGYFSTAPGQFLQYDDFVVSTNSTVTSVTWWGADLAELMPGYTVNPTSFTVSIFADNGNNAPGTELSVTTIGNSGNATVVGDLLGLSLFQYSGSLSTPFTAVAGTKYWIGITDPTDNDNWYWATGSGPNGTHFALIGGNAMTVDDDMAFTLGGVAAAVPEPSSAALILLGGLGLFGIRKRQRQHS